jgi:putative ABC transport system substrate-binding protein
MRRRDFIALTGATLAPIVLWSLAAHAQQTRRVGALLDSGPTDPKYLAVFVEALRKLGWIDGQNLRFDIRWHENNPDRGRSFAAELAALTPDVILTASTANLVAMQHATKTVPIVFLQVSDPVAQGLVTSLAQPGGNMTGFTAFEFSMGGKWLDLLKQMAPGLARVALMFHPDTPQAKLWLGAVESAGPLIGVNVIAMPVRDTGEIERGISRFASESNGGLIQPTDGFLNLNNRLIADLATRHRLPSISASELYVASGGLMYYGYVRSDQFRQAAVYVDRILRGVKPGDLPIQAPTKFELMVSLKAAKAIGIEVPIGLMLRADELVD